METLIPIESLVFTAGALAYVILRRSNELLVLKPETLALFKNYANITDEKEMKNRILRVQKTGFETYSYPCIETFSFITPRSLLHPMYKQIISNVRNGSVLDLGCCMGADARQMVVDGVNKEKIFGIDLEKTFIELGFELFDDREAMHDKFFAMDIFDKNTWPTQISSQHFGVIYCGSVLHLLNRQDGIKLIQFSHDFLVTGGILFGRSVGSIKEPFDRYKSYESDQSKLRYMHTAASLTELLSQHGFKNIKVTVGTNEVAQARSVRSVEFINETGMLAFYAEKA
jgi:phospholipid N-methyltransferase